MSFHRKLWWTMYIEFVTHEVGVDCLAARRETGCRGRFIRRGPSNSIAPARWLLKLRLIFWTGRRTCDSRMEWHGTRQVREEQHERGREGRKLESRIKRNIDGRHETNRT
jgi:hypothetical protein